MHTLQDYTLIRNVVDKYFDFMSELGGTRFTSELIPKIMLDANKHCDGGQAYWLPVASTVTEAEFDEFESFVDLKLPGSFKYFIKQRHFLELELGGNGIGFFRNLPGKLLSEFREIVDQDYSDLLDRRYIPFANYMDTGVLCFDANKKVAMDDYPIVMLDHEDFYDTTEFYANNFLEMFDEFDKHLDDWIKNSREKRSKAS